jgi:hypothetical protein
MGPRTVWGDEDPDNVIRCRWGSLVDVVVGRVKRKRKRDGYH